MTIRSLLIANRGEIACRVIRTAHAFGIRTIAVYSDADVTSPHVTAADMAVRIGPAPVAQSYLNAETVLNAARATGADAIHPGYGFLSENADFAQSVIAAGLTWVGPPPEAIRIMGDKAGAKRAMISAGVPCVPGYEGDDQSDEALVAAASDIGFPLMVKASAGGGGRGMRVVEETSDLPAALDLARSEAENAFGDGRLILERAIQRPRHVEIQVFADAHGTVLHMGERDCSVQRRHQKVLEEAPCPVMTSDLRAAMGAAAVDAARAVDYRGAGTVEFLLDEGGEFHFLEMNTRLQVEHPVTEMVTGLDLVALQLQVAEGAPLGITQDEICLTGHAIEARLYAEDPADGFLPSTGPVAHWQPPSGVRADAGIETGGEVSSHYDAMVAKVVAHGPTRDAALRKLATALDQTVLLGPRSNLAFLADAIARPAFVQGQATTAFVDEEYCGGFVAPPPSVQDLAIAGLICHLAERAEAQVTALGVPDELLDWSSSVARSSICVFETTNGQAKIRVQPTRSGQYVIDVGDESQIVAGRIEFSGSTLKVNVCRQGNANVTDGTDARPLSYRYSKDTDARLHLSRGAIVHVLVDQSRRRAGAVDDAGGGSVTAPMHGRLVSLDVTIGALVAKGERLAVLEAMKMQHAIVAEVDGTVSAIHCAAEDQIAAGDMILEIAPLEEHG